ncbi:GntR family transcriptional regulator [Brevibacterium sp. CS2]|uniref:GntR family transcriptional regulator n=1 Tax=Brevibacterium sp. CS2 TaxID=2575923 RepID=UPI0010C77CE3|nr:GntR family transcriptional regulator [Brevibacterium sp. CS2]QCP04166.1 GntR family transcriptional regulator [Brevibacterium sp. CS2]
MSAQPGPSPNARQYALTALRERISAGLWEPGEKVNEQELAATLGVSRNTLREAFAALSGDGIITRVPNRGVFISSPGIADVRDIYGARAALEPAALQWGRDLDVGLLSQIVTATEEARGRGDRHAVADANQRFHREIVAGLGSPALDETMARLLARMRLVFVRVLAAEPDFHAPYVDENRQVVGLLQARERAEAAGLLRVMIMRTGDRLADLLR